MAMRRSGTSRAAHGSDHFATRHVLSNLHLDRRHMAVAGCNPVPVVDHHDVAIPSMGAGEDDPSVGRGFNCGSVIGRDIQSGMIFISAPAKGVAAASEPVGNVPMYGPSVRCRGEFYL